MHKYTHADWWPGCSTTAQPPTTWLPLSTASDLQATARTPGARFDATCWLAQPNMPCAPRAATPGSRVSRRLTVFRARPRSSHMARLHTSGHEAGVAERPRPAPGHLLGTSARSGTTATCGMKRGLERGRAAHHSQTHAHWRQILAAEVCAAVSHEWSPTEVAALPFTAAGRESLAAVAVRLGGHRSRRFRSGACAGVGVHRRLGEEPCVPLG